MAVTGPFNLEYAMALWRRITAPTLIVHGAESGEFWREQAGRDLSRARRSARAGSACFRDARFVEIPGAGHMVHFDRPRELVTAIREFLEAPTRPERRAGRAQFMLACTSASIPVAEAIAEQDAALAVLLPRCAR